MKIPRDITASDLIRALRVLGYETIRQAWRSGRSAMGAGR